MNTSSAHQTVNMRKLAKKILFETMKQNGCEEVLFSSGKVSDKSGLIETVIDAMEIYRKQKKVNKTKNIKAKTPKKGKKSDFFKSWSDVINKL